MAIRRVAVIGTGVMGAGIAAHVANAGVPVLLLDIVAEEAGSRNALAEAALERLARAEPAAYTEAANARLVSPGNLDDDLHRLADVDWIIEAVVERLEAKQALYRRLETARRPTSVVSSNTSTIPLARLTEGLPESFQRDFMVTHFFNPPRYMRLLELVAGPRSRAQAVATVAGFCDRVLGKSVVEAHDTPGFIANRIGIFWIQSAMLAALEMGVTVEEADAVLGRPLGIPRTGVFGLADLVGIDLMPHLMESLCRSLPDDDALVTIGRRVPPLVQRLIREGYTGRKGKGGFYRLERRDGAKVKLALDLASGEYRPVHQPQLPCLEAAAGGGPRALLESGDRGGRFAWRVLSRTLAYVAGLVPEVAGHVDAVDEAMRLGYNWRLGPFELMDRLGPAWLAAGLGKEGLAVPPLLEAAVGAGSFYRVQAGRLQHLAPPGGYRDLERPEGVLRLADVKRAAPPLAGNASASLWDIGQGVVCLEFHTKMNTLDPQVLAMARQAIGVVQEGHRALVIHNEGANFSAGANLGLLLFALNVGLWEDIEAMVREGQDTFRALRYAPFPVVGAPAGLALGGGCELLLHCDAIQAHAETYTGLVEAGVGLVPGWGGCKELLRRWMARAERPGGPMPPVSKVFELISTATVSKSAAEARRLGFLGPDDGITANRDRLLADARDRALALARHYDPPSPPVYRLPGPAGRSALEMAAADFRRRGLATAYDTVVAGAVAGVLSGGECDPTEVVDEERLLALEREAFMGLIRRGETAARLEHMLQTGKPLRN